VENLGGRMRRMKKRWPHVLYDLNDLLFSLHLSDLTEDVMVAYFSAFNETYDTKAVTHDPESKRKQTNTHRVSHTEHARVWIKTQT